MQLIRYAIIVTLLFGSLSFCKAQNQEVCVDKRFTEDTTLSKYDDFHFDPAKLPVAGMRVESLTNLDPRGPSVRLTYLKPFQKEINGKKFSVDLIFSYSYARYVDYSSPNAYGSTLLERLELTVFIFEGIVQYHFVKHFLRSSPDQQIMTEGKYNSGPVNNNEFHPGSIADTGIYWSQRSLYDRIQNVPHRVTDAEYAEYERLKKAGKLCEISQ